MRRVCSSDCISNNKLDQRIHRTCTKMLLDQRQMMHSIIDRCESEKYSNTLMQHGQQRK